ncbi:ABC transporter permease [Ornithinimicrobium faecis]|uniref:ABC transporter permease n=1 Tax=Ornithinimicrobium faecis TaxID=2934158 RepID=A0ABY4YWY0_9MICO|nr:ABC transporter permease [Ornithinimicrobium sp. HY1793]USQ81277.1 ABC transporter permease [Ornithinimicrobium sp. HY1793]
MLLFLGKRLVAMVGVLLVVSLLVFSLLALSPGSIVSTLIGTRPATPELVAALEAQYHVNDPFLVQYWHWLTNAVQGDFGNSVRTGQPVTTMMAARLPLTMQLAAYALALVLAVGVPLGMLAGMRRGRLIDRFASTTAIVAMSAPAFAVAILLVWIFGVWLEWFPVYGAGEGLLERVRHLTLPAVSLALAMTALLLRQTRAATMHVMDQDYVTFARARGVDRARILLRYALRNTALPIITAAGVILVVALSGTVLVERVFAIQGVGTLMIDSVNNSDIPVVQGLAILVALLVVIVNLFVDLLTLAIDPRTRK